MPTASCSLDIIQGYKTNDDDRMTIRKSSFGKRLWANAALYVTWSSDDCRDVLGGKRSRLGLEFLRSPLERTEDVILVNGQPLAQVDRSRTAGRVTIPARI